MKEHEGAFWVLKCYNFTWMVLIRPNTYVKTHWRFVFLYICCTAIKKILIRFYYFSFFKFFKGFSLSKNEMKTRNQGLKGKVWPLPAFPTPSPPHSQASVLLQLQWSHCCTSNMPDAYPSCSPFLAQSLGKVYGYVNKKNIEKGVM